MRERESLPEPLHVFITGGAGTGKSHLIAVIKEHIERTLTGSQNACMLVAPTGVAAFNIGGLTIHYAFWLPVEHGNLTRYTKLSAQKLHELRLLCKDIHTIIIDKISMVSYETLSFIHQRLTEIKGTDDTEVYFGGLSIITVGDSINCLLFVTGLCFKMAGVMCQHLRICGGNYLQWWNSTQICNKEMIPTTQKC